MWWLHLHHNLSTPAIAATAPRVNLAVDDDVDEWPSDVDTSQGGESAQEAGGAGASGV